MLLPLIFRHLTDQQAVLPLARRLAAYCGLAGVFILAGDMQGADGLRLVALVGSETHGFPEGEAITRLTHAYINNLGQVAFGADEFLGAGLPFAQSVWVETPTGSIRRVARSGDLIPGPVGRPIENLFGQPASFNDAGQVGFVAELAYGTSSTGGNAFLISAPSGDIDVVVHIERFSSPSPPEFGVFDQPLMNNAGHTAFAGGKLDNSERYFDPFGVWTRESAGEPQLIAAVGAPVPNLPGRSFAWSFHHVSFNDQGHVAFRAHVAPERDGLAAGPAIFCQDENGLSLVAIQGQQVPDAAAGVTFYDFDSYSPLAWNNANEAAFKAQVTPAQIGDFRSGIWRRDRLGAIKSVVRQHDVAPGTADAAFDDFFQVQHDDSGRISFKSVISGPSVEEDATLGIWQTGVDGESIHKIALQGDLIPGGVRLLEFGEFSVNNRGQVAFTAIFESLTEGSRVPGVWATDRSGKLQLILKAGDVVDLGEGFQERFRTVSSAALTSSNPSSTRLGFNDLGQIALRAEFEDGSTAFFVSNLATIPEPNALLPAVIGTITLINVQRRRIIRSTRRA